MRYSIVIMLIVIVSGSSIYGVLMPKSYGYQNEYDDKSNVMQEILSWNFSNLNPDAVIFGNTIRVMEGPSGHSLKFNGKNDFVRVTSSIMGQVHDLTVSAWIKPDYNLTSKQFTVINKPESFSLYLKSDGSAYHAVFSVYAGAKWYTVESKKPIDAHWTKLLGVFDGRFIGIYVDNEIDSFDLVQTPTITDLFPIVYSDISSSDVLVGASANGSVTNNFFSGQIDEIQVLPSGGYLIDAVDNQSTLSNATEVPSNVTTLSNATEVPSNVTTLSNATEVPSNVTTLSNATEVPSNVTTLSNATEVPSNVTTLSNATEVPSNVTTLSNATEVPSNVTKPIRYYSFNLNSALPENMEQNVTIVNNGITGTALQLTTGGYMHETIPKTNNLSNLSLSVWVHPDYNTGAKTFTIINKANSFLLQIQNIAEDQGTASFSIFDGISWHTVESKAKIPIGWTHLAATFNGSAISIYVNGSPDSSQSVSKLGVSESGQLQSGNIVNLNSDSDVLVGVQLGNGGTYNAFNGLIDELSIYDISLDDAQIHNVFESIVKSSGYSPNTVIPIIIPENLSSLQTPVPTTELNFSLNSQNKSNTFGDAVISSSGINGSSLELSGHGFTSQSINSTNQISSLTISAWVKPDYQKGSSEYTVLSKDKSFLLTIHNNVSPRKIASFAIFDGVSWHTVESKSKIPEAWTHLAATFNGTSISLYVNGVKEGTQFVSSLGISISGQLETKTIQNLESDADVLIGAQKSNQRDQTTFQGMFGGKIDEVHIYKPALSTTEIGKEYLQNVAAVKEPQISSPLITPTVQLNATTQANATIQSNVAAQIPLPVQSNVTLPITMSVKKHKSSYLMTENPEFDFEFISSDVLKKHGKSTKESLGEQQTGRWTDSNGTITVDVTDPNGQTVPVNANFVKLRDGKFDIKLDSERAGKAGVYKMKITLSEGGRTYTTESTYAWGLVSLNTEKSIYRPGETAAFSIVVLDNGGHSVCDSNIVMNIHDPTSGVTTLSTGNGITANPSCGLYGAQYIVPESGNYTVDLTAQNPSGVANFTTSFLAADNFDFDVVRTADSKIDPTSNPNSFRVKIDVSSFVNVNNVIIQESVPSSFKVKTDATVQTMGDVQILTWSKSLIGNNTSVSYTYSVPEVYPQLYSLGPIQITSGSTTYFKEARPCFVAVDPAVNKLYLRAFTSTDDPTNGEKSTALPVGTFKGNSGTGFEDLSLSSIKGVATTSATEVLSSLAQTAHQDNYIARFTSSPLAAQTIPAGTWTFALQTSEANNNANSFIIASVYVWRPSTSSVVGYIYDSDTPLGTRWGTTTTGRLVTISGSSVATQAGDVLVFEMWRHAATQAAAAGYAQTLYYDGTTDVTNGGTAASAASYIQSTSKLILGRQNTDSLSLLDSISLSVTKHKSLSDSVSITDSIATSTIKTKLLSDSISVTDSITKKSSTKSLSDSVSAIDSAGASSNKFKSISDTMSISDTRTSSATRILSLTDNLSIIDSEATSSTKTKSLSDSASITDSITKSSSKSLSDYVSVTDSTATSTIKFLSLSDSASITDSITKSSSKPLSDSASITDSITIYAIKTKSLSDSASITDSITKSSSKPLSDSASITDSITKSSAKSLSDSASITDSITIYSIKTKPLSDSASITDSITKSSSKPLSDSASITDSITKSSAKSLS